MSADNGIYILKSDGPEWRVIEAQAIENIYWNEKTKSCADQPYFNQKEVVRYFGRCEVFLSEEEVDVEACRLVQEIADSACPILEYGISVIHFPGKFPDPPKIIISSDEMDRFFCLRSKIFKLIDNAIEKDGHHKSYEGALSINFPNRFEDHTGTLRIELFCYVLGNGRRHEWEGKTLTEILDKMDLSINKWEHENENVE